MYEYLLPIGTVVKLNNSEKPLMIFGVLQNNKTVSEKTFDYIGVPYPEGHFDPRLHLGFDQHDIETIVFKGYEGKEYLAFLSMLEIANQLQIEKG